MTHIKKFLRENAMILAIIFIAFFLRAVNHSSLSGGDDSQYAQFAMFSIEKPINFLYLQAQDEHIRCGGVVDNRPFSRIFPGVFTYLFGNNDFSILITPIIFSMLSTLIIYLFVKRYYKKEIALLSAFIFAILPHNVAFSRIALLDSQLIFYMLTICYFVTKGVEENKVKNFYFASFILTIDLLTTSYRGALPIISLLPFLIIKKINLRKIKHLAVAFAISMIIYVGYSLLPMLYGNDLYINNLIKMSQQAVGQNPIMTDKLSFFDSMGIVWKYLLFTPLMSLIMVPLVFGFVRLFKNWKTPTNSLWIIWGLSSFLQFVNGQPHINRQSIIMPAFCFISAYGIWNAYDDFCRKKDNKQFPLLMALTGIYLIVTQWIFAKIFPAEFSSLLSFVNASGSNSQLLSVGNAFFLSAVLIIAFTCFGFLMFRMNKSQKKKEEIKAARIAKAAFIAYLVISFLIISALVIFGIGAFKRTDTVNKISDYIKNNPGNEEYSCITGIDATSFTYYIGKKCAFFWASNQSFIEQQAKEGNLKYFILNIYNTELKTPGFGDYYEMEKDLYKDSGEDIDTWRRNYPEKYFWLKENTKDITAKVGIGGDNPYFRVFEYNKTIEK